MSMLRNAAAGVALATFGFASAASAATTDSADVRAEILTALSVQVDTTDDVLDFGTFADGGITGNVTLTIDPADGSLVNCPANAVCAGTTDAPTFDVDGADGLDVLVTFVNATEPLAHPNAALYPSMDTTLSVGSFTTNLTGNQLTLDADGESFAVGGTLTVSPNQAPGVYTGTVSVRVEYN